MPVTLNSTGITFSDGSTLATSAPAVGAIRSYAFMTPNNNNTYIPGATLAGSSLRYCGVNGLAVWGYGSSPLPAGTWRCMGYTGAFSSGESIAPQTGTLWYRYA